MEKKPLQIKTGNDIPTIINKQSRCRYRKRGIALTFEQGSQKVIGED